MAILVGMSDVAMVYQEQVECKQIAPARHQTVAVLAVFEIDPANPARHEHSRSTAQCRQSFVLDSKPMQPTTPISPRWIKVVGEPCCIKVSR
jgi:hypothetical protein